MSNRNWVCFPCRTAVRRPGGAEDVRCPSCAQQCSNIGYKIPVPPKAKLAAWKSLESEYFKSKRIHAANFREAALHRFHELEREIQRIDVLPENAGRRGLLKRLKAELENAGLQRL